MNEKKSKDDISKNQRHQMIFNILRHQSEESALSISEIHTKLLSKGACVTRKTVERDMAVVSNNYKLLETETHPLRYYPSDNFSPEYELLFSEAELQIMTLAIDNLKQTSPKYLQNLCIKTETTLTGKLPKDLARDLYKFKKLHHFSYGVNGRAKAKDEKAFEVIMECLRSRHSFYCQNLSPYKDQSYNIKKRLFAPLLFLMSAGTPYLVVRDLEDKNDIKILRMTRLVNAISTHQQIDPIKKSEMQYIDFTFGGYLGNDINIIEYEIICTKKLATYFEEREVHHSQEIVKIEDNKFKINFKLVKSNEIIRILTSFHSEIIEISPKIINNEIKLLLQNAS